MLQNYNRYKLLKVFLDNSTESFRLRELSRMSKISPPSVLNYLKEFEKQDLIKRYEKRDVPFYQANLDNEDFIQYKKLSILFELHDSGLIDFLWEKLSPEAIILYGSQIKGESTENSDIDLFIIGKEKRIDIEKFQKKLNSEIHLLFEKNPINLPKELKNNLIIGVVLKGYLKLF